MKSRFGRTLKSGWFRWFLLLVGLPFAVVTFYYAFIASEIYVSESRFVIKSPGSRPAQMSTLANLLQTTGLSSGQEQANEVLDYVRSRNAVADLERRYRAREAYSAQSIDFLSRYPKPWWQDRDEMFHRYYGDMVAARFDHDTGSVVLTVKAFTPKDAYEINNALLGLSEGLVNRLNDRAQNNSISEALRRRADAEARMRKASLDLTRYRNSREIVDPAKQAVAALELSNRLISEQSGLRAQLEVMERAAPANPTIPALRRRIGALDQQILNLNRRVVGNDAGIASKISGYDNLVVEQEFATQMLTAAEAALAQARVEMQKQQFYLERIVQPNRPDMALLPHRFRTILAWGAALISLFMVGWMLVVGIREHAPEN